MKSALAACTIAVVVFLIRNVHACTNYGSKTWAEVSVRTDSYDIGEKKPSFMKIPLNSHLPSMEPYVQIEPGPCYMYADVVSIYCLSGNPRFCALYDMKCDIVGVWMSFIKSDYFDVPPSVFNATYFPDFLETTIFGMDCWTVAVYFTNPDKLTADGVNNTCEIGDGVWTQIDGKMVMLPRKQPIGPIMLQNFDLQGCYKGIGNKFVHNFNRYKSCNNYNFLALYAQGFLVGFGFARPGYGSAGETRDWYEHPAGVAVPFMIPNAASCVYDILDCYQYTTMHVFLIKQPRRITCRRCNTDCYT